MPFTYNLTISDPPSNSVRQLGANNSYPISGSTNLPANSVINVWVMHDGDPSKTGSITLTGAGQRPWTVTVTNIPPKDGYSIQAICDSPAASFSVHDVEFT